MPRSFAKDGYTAPEPISLFHTVRKKCPVCKRKISYSKATRYSGYGVENCYEKTYDILYCKNCGFRINISGLDEKTVHIQRKKFIAAGLIALVLMVAIGKYFTWNWQQRKGEDAYEAGLSAYQNEAWQEAVACFEEAASFQYNPAKIMLAWCQLKGLGCEPSAALADELIDNVENTDVPYYWALRGVRAWEKIQQTESDSDEQKSLSQEVLSDFDKCFYMITFPDPKLFSSLLEICRMMDTQKARRLEFEILKRSLAAYLPDETITTLSAETEEKLNTYLNGESVLGEMGNPSIAEDLFRLGQYHWILLEDEQALKWWYAAIQNGSTDALCQIGKLYFYGGDTYHSVFFPASDTTASLYARAAQKAGDSNGTVLYAQILLESDRQHSLALLEEALSQENGMASCLLGDLKENNAYRVDYYLYAYERYHCADGYQRLGQYYLDAGAGHVKDRGLGWSYIQIAANEGSTLAQIACGANYYYMRYTQLNDAEDYSKGLHYLTAAAQKRDEYYNVAYEILSSKYQIFWETLYDKVILGEE